MPNYSERHELQSNLSKTIIKIPEKLRKNNIFIQFKGLSQNKTLTYFSTLLKVQIIEPYAQIKVTDQENKPLSKVKFYFDIVIFKPLIIRYTLKHSHKIKMV